MPLIKSRERAARGRPLLAAGTRARRAGAARPAERLLRDARGGGCLGARRAHHLHLLRGASLPELSAWRVRPLPSANPALWARARA